MEGPFKERWKNLSKAVAEEKDPVRFAELVQELLKELEAKEKRLKSPVIEHSQDRHGEA